MGVVAIYNNPCLNPECGSHDAMQIYENGTGYCFSCKSWFSSEEINKGEILKIKVPTIKTKEKIDYNELKHKGFKDRQITTEVAKFFDVRVSFDENGQVEKHYYPYGDETYKIRKLPKDFVTIGKLTKLFGQDKFNSGGKKLIITEGEIDAMSVAQASLSKYKKIYPVVSIPSASQTKVLLENRDWIRSFEEVVICFDEDKAGKQATEDAIKYIGIDKVKTTKLPFKDANEVLLKKGTDTLMHCIFDAAKYIPSGIIGKEELWEALKTFNSIPAFPYPPCLEGINTKLKGMRPGEISLFISGTGTGKSTIMREIMLHILEETKAKIGIVSLEESPAETARLLSGMKLKRNPANEEINLEDLKVGFDAVFGEDRVVLLDHQGSMNDDNIVEKLEFMALSGCEYIFIDHITILVSEGIESLTGNEAQDKMMNDLVRLVKRHPVWIGLVSHLRKASIGRKSFEEGRFPSIDDIRGSGSVKQISYDIISFTRNLTADDEIERNTIKMRILKCRQTGLTGTVPGAEYVFETGRLNPSDGFVEEEFVTL